MKESKGIGSRKNLEKKGLVFRVKSGEGEIGF